MSTTGSRPVLDVNGKLLGTGAVLLCIGGAVLMTGAALASVALAQAAKKWIDQLEESPAVMAQRHLHHLKVAAEAVPRPGGTRPPDLRTDAARVHRAQATASDPRLCPE